MKRLWFIIAFIFSLHINTRAQYIADAGRDTAFCGHAALLNHVLGGNPSGQSADTVLFFEWTMITSLTYPWTTASDFIDSISTPNPNLITSWVGDETFVLKVSDSMGNVCFDSVTLHGTSYFCWTGSIFDDTVFAMIGDTVIITGAFPCEFDGAVPPYTYQWHSDSTIISAAFIEGIRVKVNRTKVYGVIKTDANGCSWTGFRRVVVLTTDIDGKESPTLLASIFPNPANNQIEISIPAEALQKYRYDGLQFQLYEVTGKAIQTQIITSEKPLLSVAHLPQGIYYWRMASASHTLQQGKLAKH